VSSLLNQVVVSKCSSSSSIHACMNAFSLVGFPLYIFILTR